MIISYNWLKDYLNIDLEIHKTSEILTDIGLEVGGIEEVQSVKGGLVGLVVGEVLTCVKHPNADKLSVTTVNVGAEEPLPIVCGAPNVAAGQKVVVATVGTVLYSGDDSFTIKKSKIRGEASQGMICAEDEIGLGQSHEGIMVLDESAVPGTLAKDYFNIESDYQIEIDLTPNRIDGASHIGVARDLAAYLKLQDKAINYTWPSVDNFNVDHTNYKVDVSVENNEACPRYSGVTIEGLRVSESPEWLRKKMVSIGMSPINNVVDITNFVLHETGQPLHAFDGDKIEGDKIIVKTLEDKSKFVTLDGEERELSAADLMICNPKEGMCIAGVFGGLDSGVTASTTKLFLESAYFNPVWVRKTSKRHTLNTDASFRFERGTDPEKTIYALKRAALLIKEIAGGSISSEIVDIYPNKISPNEVHISFGNVNRLIGENIPTDTIKSILTNLEFDIVSESPAGLNLRVPTYRVDVTREADVIEEILRIYGYNTVEISKSVKSTIIHSVKPDDHKLKNLIAATLNGAGYTEIMSNSLTKSSYYEGLEEWNADNSVVLLNPLSSDLNSMRQSLLFGGLESIARNSNYKNPDLKLYEFGNCYALQDANSQDISKRFKEKQSLALFLTGNLSDQSWINKDEKSSFYHLKAMVNQVVLRLGISLDSVKVVENKADSFNGGLRYEGKSGQELVKFGMVSNAILSSMKIEAEVFYADFNWDNLLMYAAASKVRYNEISNFPEVKRDLALLVDQSVQFDELEKIAFKTDAKLLKRVNLFDVYQGKGVPEGKKSYAISFYLQDANKNLVDKVIDKTMNKLMGAYKHRLGAEVRGK